MIINYDAGFSIDHSLPERRIWLRKADGWTLPLANRVEELTTLAWEWGAQDKQEEMEDAEELRAEAEEAKAWEEDE